MSTLTTANSALTLSVRSLFNVPVAIQGYSTDDSFSTEDVSPAEIQYGVDGNMSFGYVPYPTMLKVVLQADSLSVAIFDAVLAAQVAQKELFVFDGTLYIQGTGVKHNFTKGILTKASPTPASKKILQPRAFEITFEKASPAPI